MNLLRRNTAKGLCLGIEAGKDNLRLALCSPLSKAADSEVSSEIKDLKLLSERASRGDQGLALKDWVNQQQLKGTLCNVSLSSGEYQLLLTEAPEVPEQELRAAIRWKIKELSSIPLEDAAIDVFLLPKDGARSSKGMAYVAVSEINHVKQIINMVSEAGLKLNAIDIPELALRNLSLLKPEGQSGGLGLGVIHVLAGKATVYLYRQGNLYLSRQFNLDYGGGLLDDIPEDSFLLEVQRSLDYYERQMGQTPPVTLYICGENISGDKINTGISRGLSVPAKYLDLDAAFCLNDENFEPGLLQQCSVALGSALRDQVHT